MKKEYNKYEDNIIYTDSITGTDIKINPDYYIHITLTNAINSLKNENVEMGLMQFRVYIEMLERQVKSTGRLPEDYYNSVDKFKNTNEYKETTVTGKETKIALLKMELLQNVIFTERTATTPLKA